MPGQSRIEAIMENILGAHNTLEPPGSRTERILLCILNDTPYEGTGVYSRIEKMLLCILNGTRYTGTPRSRIEEILLCKVNGREYTGETRSRIEELLSQWTKQG